MSFLDGMSTATDVTARGPYVSLSVWLSVTLVHPAKAAARNEMSFVRDTRMVPRRQKSRFSTRRKVWGLNPSQNFHCIALSLYHNCDPTTIRLRHDYDEKLRCSFFARVEWKEARAIRRSRIVVVL